MSSFTVVADISQLKEPVQVFSYLLIQFTGLHKFLVNRRNNAAMSAEFDPFRKENRGGGIECGVVGAGSGEVEMPLRGQDLCRPYDSSARSRLAAISSKRGSFTVRPLHAWRSDTIEDDHAQTRQQQPAWQR